MSGRHRHLPVSGPRADDALARPERSLDAITDEDVEQLVADVTPSPLWGLFALQGGIIGVIATCVATGVAPFALLLKLGAPAWLALVGMIAGAVAGLPLFGGVVALLSRLARAFLRSRHQRAVAALNLDASSTKALLAALEHGADVDERRGRVLHLLAGAEEPFDPIVRQTVQRDAR